MTWIPFALLLIAAVLAFPEADKEVKESARRNKAGEGDLDHDMLVFRRLVGVLVLLLLSVIPAALWGPDDLPDWKWSVYAACLVGTMWCSFHIVHRLRFNWKRKMDWRFVSGSSWFDRMCLWAVSGVNVPTKYFNSLYHGHFTKDQFRPKVHKAGVISYIAIALVLALSLGGAVWILHSGEGVSRQVGTALSAVVLAEDGSGLLASIAYATLG